MAILCVLVMAVGAISLTAFAQEENTTLKAGYATVDLNPYWSIYEGTKKPSTMKQSDIMPLPMAGYGDNTHRLSAPTLVDDNGDGVISGPAGDGLHATCLAIQSGKKTVLIITLDLISVNSTNTKKIRAQITEATGIPADCIMVSGSHTHGGVDLSASFTEAGEPYVSADGKTNYTATECNAYLAAFKTHLFNQLQGAAVTAVKDLSETTMEKGSIDVGAENGNKPMNGVRHYNQSYNAVKYVRGSSFNNNVNNDNTYDSYYANAYSGKNPPDSWKATHVSESDDSLHLLRFCFRDKEDILLVNWRAHPTGNNKQAASTFNNLSSDYIGAIRYGLDSSGYRTAFILGASGNLGSGSALPWESWIHDATEANQVLFGVEYGRILTKSAETLLGKTTTTASGEPMKAIENGPILTSQVKYRMLMQIPGALELAAARAYKDNESNIKSYDSYVYTDPSSGEKFVIASSYHANAVINRSVYSEGQTRSIELNVITVGDALSFIAMPFEASDRYSMEATLETANSYNDWDLLAQVRNFGTPFVMTCANDHIGYIPNHLAYNYNTNAAHYGKYAVGSYESQTSLAADGEGEKILAVYRDMLEEMEIKTTYCQHCKKTVSWEPLTANLLTANSHHVPSGHYFLHSDLTYTDNQVSLTDGAQVCLDLNGHTYSVAHPKNASRAFNISGGSVLNIFDTSKAQTGQIIGHGVLVETAPTGFAGGTLNIGFGCEVNLYGGTLTQDTSEQYHATTGGVVRVVGGVFNMYGGTVRGGKAALSSDGGNIYICSTTEKDENNAVVATHYGTFNMCGGTVADGVAGGRGGNIFVASGCSFKMSGGTVHGGVATGLGDNLYVIGTGNFSMSGGKITDSAAATGFSVYAEYSSSNKLSIKLSGTTDGNEPVEISFSKSPLNMLQIDGVYTGKLLMHFAGAVSEGTRIGQCTGSAVIGGAQIRVAGYEQLVPQIQNGYLTMVTLKPVSTANETGILAYYATLKDALKAYEAADSTATYLLLNDALSEETVTLSKDLTMDLKGHSIGKLSLSGSGQLLCMDSQTDDFTVADSIYGTVPAAAGAKAAEGYYMYTHGDTVSFHKLEQRLTSVSLRTAAAGFYYCGFFGADELVKSQIQEYGIALSTEGVPTAQQIREDTENKSHVSFTGWNIGPDGNTDKSALLQGILDRNDGYGANKRDAQTKVYAVTYVQTDQGILLGDPVCFSLRDVMESISRNWSAFTAAQQADVIAFYQDFALVMSTWKIDELCTAAAK